MKKRILALLATLCLIFSQAVPVYAAVDDTGFSDVAADAWYADAVAYARDNNLMSGTSSSTFSPNITTTRAMLVTVLYRQAGSPAVQSVNRFTDVSETAWYYDAVLWAAANGIVSGYSDGRFGGNDPITREQLATILWRSEGSPDSGTSTAFADQAHIASYAVDAVAWARAEGIVSGMEGNRFAPQNGATRAQMAAMLYRWLDQTETPDPVPPADDNEEEQEMPILIIEVGDQSFTATLEDNPTTRELLERLPMTLTMGELNGNEKYYYLDESLPTNSGRPGQIQTGDLMLYGSDCLVLFYESFSSSYSYTRLGRVDEPSGLAAALGRGSVSVSFRVS